MSALSNLPTARRWPAQHPDPLQLCSLATPNRVTAFRARLGAARRETQARYPKMAAGVRRRMA